MLKTKKIVKMKRRTKVIIIVIAAILVWNHLPYRYSNEKTVAYVTNHTAIKSRSMCAWYVTKAMWRGGCPIGLVPAYAYENTLPQMGFNEISTNEYKPMKGDIAVMPQNEESSFGHIAIYDGNDWVSDFKHKKPYPNTPVYKKNGFKIFRANDGWHWKHVWTTPVDWYGWMKSLVKGFNKIKFRQNQ